MEIEIKSNKIPFSRLNEEGAFFIDEDNYLCVRLGKQPSCNAFVIFDLYDNRPLCYSHLYDEKEYVTSVRKITIET